jgi:hypothetical protein
MLGKAPEDVNAFSQEPHTSSVSPRNVRRADIACQGKRAGKRKRLRQINDPAASDGVANGKKPCLGAKQPSENRPLQGIDYCIKAGVGNEVHLRSMATICSDLAGLER